MTDADRERFLNTLSESVERYDIRLYLYCLMQNHTHFVLETPRGNLGRFMHRLQTAYTVYFNRRHQRSGHLMQGRYGAVLVDEDTYILRLSRYVHLNPVFVRANRSKSIAERISLLRSYPWSSYRGYIGKCKHKDFVDYDPVLAMMDGSRRTVKSQYRRFVEAGISDIDAAVIYAKQRSPLCIGSDDSVDRVESLYHELVESRNNREDISFRRMSFSLDSESILSAVCEAFAVDRQALYQRRRNSFLRPMASKFLCDYGGYTQREVGDMLKIGNGASVSKQLHKISNLLTTDPDLQKLHEAIVKHLKIKERADP